jgi:lipid-A-disaccharide synthase
MDKEVVTELIQENCTTKNLKIELQKLLDSKYITEVLENYTTLEKKLGGSGASQKTAQLIVNTIR